VAERLRGKPFDDADVWRAAVAAVREILMKARGAPKLCRQPITAANTLGGKANNRPAR
jgi:hypothetical protein